MYQKSTRMWLFDPAETPSENTLSLLLRKIIGTENCDPFQSNYKNNSSFKLS